MDESLASAIAATQEQASPTVVASLCFLVVATDAGVAEVFRVDFLAVYTQAHLGDTAPLPIGTRQ